MSDIIVLILVVGLPIAWLVAEFRGPRWVRILLGLACMAVIINAWMFSRQRTIHHNNWHRTLIARIGQTIDNGDVQGAREAIRRYETARDIHPAQPALKYLADRERTTTTESQNEASE